MALLAAVLKLKLFPIKDSYIAYFRKDPSAVLRNPKTVQRICGRLYEMGLDVLFEKISEPKETNRQIGLLFKRWLDKKALGLVPVDMQTFMSNDSNAILKGSDQILMDFAKQYLNYDSNKGLDFVARFNKKYVVGEAKFITDFGGHQNAQFSDAMQLLTNTTVDAIKIAILDGVLYIRGNNKLFKQLCKHSAANIILSSLLLREFLYQI